MEKKTYGKLNDLNLKTLVVFQRAFNSVHRRETTTIRGGGLTVAQFAVLEVLYHKGDLRVCEIMEKILSTGGNMTVVLANLEKDGWIHRYSDPNDKRAYLIAISQKGKALLDEMFPVHVENVSSIFNVLTVEEKEQLITLLKKLGGASSKS